MSSPGFEGSVFEPHYPDRFTWSDYLVFSSLLAVSMGIGIFYAFGGRNKTNEDFLMGGRSMSIWPVSLSMICSFVSAVTVLGTPLEVYNYGIQYSLLAFGHIIMSIGLATLFVPVYYNLRLISAFEYFELRFNRKVRILTSSFQILFSFLYMPVTVYAPSIALEEVIGIPGLLSSAIIFLVCIGYSTMGGLKAVLWTDALQCIVLFGSIFSIIGVGIYNIDGGLSTIWDEAKASGRTEFFNFDSDLRTRHTFWTTVISGLFYFLPFLAGSQAQIQRYLSVPTLAKAKQCVLINCIGMVIIAICVCLIGLIVYGTYAHCDPISFGKISKPDQLVALFVMDVLGHIPLLPGLFVAGLTAGSLSTVSSTLNSLAAVVTEDYIKKLRPNYSATTLANASKLVSLIGGLISFGLMFIIGSMGNVLPYASIVTGILIGPNLGCAILGMFFPWTNWIGIVVGMIPSMFLTGFLGFGSIIVGGELPNQKLPFALDHCYINNTDTTTVRSITNSTGWKDQEYSTLINILSLSYMWQAILPIISTIILGLGFSFIVRLFKNFPKCQSNHLSPPMLRLWTWVFSDESLKKWISFENEIKIDAEKSEKEKISEFIVKN